MVQLLAVVFLFVPVSFIRHYSSGIGLGSKNYNYSESWMEAAISSNGGIWIALIFLFAAINITYFILRCTTKLPIVRKKYCIAIPCCQIIFLIINAISITNYLWRSSTSLAGSHYEFSWGFYLVCALYLSVIFLELFKQFSTVDEEKKSNTNILVDKPIPTDTDELKKIKELFEQGIITKEEFDAKKKQLLGL